MKLFNPHPVPGSTEIGRPEANQRDSAVLLTLCLAAAGIIAFGAWACEAFNGGGW